MTPEASLPPADVQRQYVPRVFIELEGGVQRPTPPLTEEELAKIEAWPHLASDVPRLIADLRASRERIRELEEDLKGKMTRQEWYEDYAQW